MKTPHARAAELVALMQGSVGYDRTIAEKSYALVTDGGDPQSVFDAIRDIDPSITPAAALGYYAGKYAALAAIDKVDKLVAPDFQVFQIQQNGDVLYVPPVEPEPEP
jgi:hypothetical protein